MIVVPNRMTAGAVMVVDSNAERMQLPATWALRLSAGIFLIAAAVSLTQQGRAQPTEATANQSAAMPPGSVVWLDQGWTDQQRRIFHNQSQGTLTLPVPTSW